MNDHPSESRELQELQELLDGYDTALLVTHGEDGHYHGRPMALQRRSLSDGLWFATSEDTEKVHDLRANQQCAVVLYGGGRTSASYVSISGRAEIVRDRDVIRDMWSASWKPWFPDGPEQSDLVLIHVHPEHAEYVHPQTGVLKVVFTMVKKLVTHSREEPAPKHQLDLAP